MTAPEDCRYQTGDSGPSSGGIAVEPHGVRATLQARVTALENAFKSMLKELDSHSSSINLAAKFIADLQEEVGLSPPPETPSNPEDSPRRRMDERKASF